MLGFPEFPKEIPLPSQIGRYEIKRLLGQGGMGDLYLAHDPNTNRLVALKVLNATLDSDELRQRFVREARALAALNHPNIVNAYDTGDYEGSPFIVMEYVEGETLAEIISRRAALSVAQKLKLMTELCAGLAQAHAAGIVHRDIKPANLMVDRQGRLKILDFGIARVVESHRTRVSGPLTQVNMAIGTPGYMSPEQIAGGQVDRRSDIFAVGAVCYELLSYSEAFSGTSTSEVERRVLQAPPAPLASVVPGLDPEIDEIVFRALERDPDKRYQDAATFEQALERVRSRLEPGATVPPRRPTPPPRPAPSPSVPPRPATSSATVVSTPLSRTSTPSRSAPTVIGPFAAPPDQTMASARTVIGPSTAASGQTVASARTVVSTATAVASPKPARPPARWRRYLALWGGAGPAGRRPPAVPQPGRRPATRRGPIWTRYGGAVQVIGLLTILAVLVMGVAFIVWVLTPSGHPLTITKPTGGTISGAGINCGTQGTVCSAIVGDGEVIELSFKADANFSFEGYTGPCAPGGWINMTGPRTCGATFVPIGPAPGAMQLLTISPRPAGGTLRSVYILCGTKDYTCSAPHPEGVQVTLIPTPDPEFTFMEFEGDCAPAGLIQMTVPRTCSARFERTPAPSTAPLTTKSNRAPGGGQGKAGEGGSPPQQGSPSTRTEPEVAPATTTAPAGVGDSSEQQKPALAPISAEEFEKGKIREALTAYCKAISDLSPDGVKAVYPTVNMASLRIQLNKSKYTSATCKFSDPEFPNLDPSKGTAEVRVDLKQYYVHTGPRKPETVESIVSIKLSRPVVRMPWRIDKMDFQPKPK
jgi:serine/threonine protein kinase